MIGHQLRRAAGAEFRDELDIDENFLRDRAAAVQLFNTHTLRTPNRGLC